MKTARKFIMIISIALLTSLVGCGLEYGAEAEDEVRVSVSAGVPSEFYIRLPENVVDLRGEITSQLAQAHERAQMAEAMDRSTANGERYLDEQHMAYSWNNVADLTEFYLVGVDIDGFELAGISIGRYGFTYWYRCIMGLDGSVTIHINRLEYPLTYDEAWQIAKEHMLQSPWGAYLTEDGMVYLERINSVFARIGKDWFRMVLPDRLNNLEFLHNLALEVIATHEVVVLNR